jgi:adenosylcobinamide-GDP ribazoletransferase
MWQSFLAALCFLTIFPVPAEWFRQQENRLVQGNSLLFYPVIGLLIGAGLLAVSFFLSVFDSLLTSALLITIWIVMTGALHLDGLADTADAWLGGHGDREKTLTILKDSHAGVAAIVAIVLSIIIKILALNEIHAELFVALLITPVLARTAVMILLLTTDYVRPNGIGTKMVVAMPRSKAWGVTIVAGLLSVVLLKWNAIFILISIGLAIFLYRVMLLRRLGGTTGDTAGALIEIIEILVLLDFAAIEFLSK